MLTKIYDDRQVTRNHLIVGKRIKRVLAVLITKIELRGGGFEDIIPLAPKLYGTGTILYYNTKPEYKRINRSDRRMDKIILKLPIFIYTYIYVLFFLAAINPIIFFFFQIGRIGRVVYFLFLIVTHINST